MESGVLYVVGTPIGNLEDVTFRAIRTLKEVDLILAEDCRVTLKLLNFYSIKNHIVSYNKLNEQSKLNFVIEKLKSGKNIALVSDAGMPLISDPGEQLVKLCNEKNILVRVVPGPTAAISALCVSGFSSSSFLFVGFLSQNKKKRIQTLNSLKNVETTLIFYEAPHKLFETLVTFLEYFGNRKIAIARELTKIYEEVKILTVSEAIEAAQNNGLVLKGEHVIILEGLKQEKPSKFDELENAYNFAIDLVLKEGKSKSAAAREAARKFEVSKNEIYSQIINREPELTDKYEN